ncbi:MAG TPA: ABC transporter transmembrane domain-containing protein, partial [Chloroflexota bacterium]|nr:ABC transporter transmembrane domain-containing protein [Chloroflexota bacterium]
MRLLVPYLKRYRWRIIVGVFCIGFSTVASLLQPYYLGQAIGDIGIHYRLALRGASTSLSPLYRDVLLLMGAAILQALFAFFQRSTINRVSRYMEYDLREEMFLHLQRLDQRFYQEMHTGDL